VDAEIIDLRWLRPLDLDTVLKSVVKTSRLLCVQEGEAMGGWGEHVVAEVASSGFSHLDAPPTLLASPPVPLPYAGALEKLWMPSPEKVVTAAQELMRW
jgi:pyruvate dehydrogenase E1 component beta subunit